MPTVKVMACRAREMAQIALDNAARVRSEGWTRALRNFRDPRWFSIFYTPLTDNQKRAIIKERHPLNHPGMINSRNVAAAKRVIGLCDCVSPTEMVTLDARTVELLTG